MRVDLARLRYSLDDPELYGLEASDRFSREAVRNQGLSNAVRVTDRVLPRVMAAARCAGERLGFSEPMMVFTHASAELNARCYSDVNRGTILVFLSSSIISTLSPPEYQYIIGHELGHHMFGHHRYPDPSEADGNLRVLELMRAAEISADRAGLLACGDIDIALRAMLKVISGLDERHLDVDISDYMRQLAELRDSTGDESIYFSTHPPFPVRLRAALRFESVLREVELGGEVGKRLAEIDEGVQRDLEMAASGNRSNRFTDVAGSAAFWDAALRLCSDGTFSSSEQERMRTRFGADRVEGLKRLLANAESLEQGLEMLREKAGEAHAALADAPLIAEKRFKELIAGFE